MAHILVVDDEKSIRITVREFLLQEGHEVDVAEDSYQAFELLSNQEYDVVVTDIILPGVSGVELLKAIRSISLEVYVILITGEPTIETAAEAVREGAFDYLAKPIKEERIIDVVGKALMIKGIDDERHRLEKENKEYQMNLEKLVEERTALLKNSEQKYSSLFKKMLNGFALHEIILDNDGKPIDYKFIEINNAFELLTNLRAEDIIGKKVTEVIQGIENDHADWIGQYGRVALDGEEIKFEQFSEPLNKWFSIIAFSPQKGTFATIFEEITKRKQAEKEIQELNKNLEQKVKERTAQCNTAMIKLKHENEERSKTQTKLEKANGAKNKYFSILAHDMKNPLAAMLTSTELLKMFFHKGDASKVEKHISRLNESTAYLTALLEDVLTWARTQSDKMEFKPIKINSKKLVSDIVNLFSLSSSNKNLTIDINFKEDSSLYGDKNMVSTVFRNIVSNAIKFTNDGGKIELTQNERNDSIEFSIKDSGIGIAHDDMESLFNVDSSNKKKGTAGEKSTGLGLVLSKEFVEKHGGKIWVESKPGEGSNFFFTIPKAKVE